ncbi:MAG: hypothetical protein ACE5HU_03615 [Acidobacteriota bacterium]
MARTVLVSCCAFAVVMAAGSWAKAQELVRAEDAVVALFNLQTELTVDTKMLDKLEARYEANRRDRVSARERVISLYAELDRLFDEYRMAKGPSAKPDHREETGEIDVRHLEGLIEEKETGLLTAEKVEAAVHEEGRRLRQQIRDQRERMALLSREIRTLRASLPTQRESITGVWDVTLLPSGDEGVFALFQSGTIVTGQYVLDGPYRGSLDGTLIDRKVLLHRIDARLGRSMDFSAYLSPDGQSLRGTWENYDLANGQPRSGSWAARRRQPSKRPKAAESPEEGGP